MPVSGKAASHANWGWWHENRHRLAPPQQQKPMTLPGFFNAMPALDVPFPDEVVTTRAVRSDAGLVVFFHFHQDFSLPPHAHGPQWGTVVAGEVALTIDGQTRRHGSGNEPRHPGGRRTWCRCQGGHHRH